MKKVFKIAGIGEILWDILPGGKKLGGAPSNFAYHVSALGHKGVVVSRIGDDAYGKEIIYQLKELNLITNYIQIDKNKPTGVVEVKMDNTGQPDYIIKDCAAWDFIDWSEKFNILLKTVDAVCFGTLAQRNIISRSTILIFLKKINKNAVKVFDINLRQGFYNKQIIEESLKFANILKLNTGELGILSELFTINKKFNEKDKCRFLINNYALDLICLTKGEEGSILIDKNSFFESAAYPYKITDRVGAGDAFTAVMIINYLAGYSIDLISIFANKLASWVTSKDGAMPVYDPLIKKIMKL
jgi:fructokinase